MTYSYADIMKETGRSKSAVCGFAHRHGWGKRWTQSQLAEYKRCLHSKGQKYTFTDSELPPYLAQIRSKYKNGISENDVFILASRIENEMYENNFDI